MVDGDERFGKRTWEEMVEWVSAPRGVTEAPHNSNGLTWIFYNQWRMHLHTLAGILVRGSSEVRLPVILAENGLADRLFLVPTCQKHGPPQEFEMHSRAGHLGPQCTNVPLKLCEM